jgi:light-regulated signal transduction histidine kinase (bacteriophytochrome)
VTAKSTPFAVGYAAALANYLKVQDETVLSEAYELGRRAVNDGLGVLDVALMFQDALAGALHEQGESMRVVRAAEFLFETLAPFEMTYRGYKEANDQLKQLTEQLHAANKELEAFSYSISHDLRTPVRHIVAFSQRLLDEYKNALPSEGLRYVETIQHSAQNMKRMIEDLLNLARLDRQRLVRHPLDLNAVVAEVVRDLERDVTGRTIEWKIDALPTIDADPGLVKVVFTNLLSNAVKYTRNRTIAAIHVGRDPDESNVVVFVKDNGAGFDPQYTDKLFGVFQRLHPTEAFEGTGVGLATVERIVRKHGGTIWAEGVVDVGATFYLAFPRPSKPSTSKP